MLTKFFKIPNAAPQAASLILAKIGEAARALRLPSHSLYYAFGQERAADLRTRIDAINAALQQTKREADEAAVRLMSLDAPERVVFSSFTELIGADKNDR